MKPSISSIIFVANLSLFCVSANATLYYGQIVNYADTSNPRIHADSHWITALQGMVTLNVTGLSGSCDGIFFESQESPITSAFISSMLSNKDFSVTYDDTVTLTSSSDTMCKIYHFQFE